MHANVHADRDKASWRLPQDETLQVADSKTKKSNDLSYVYDGHNWKSIIFSLLVIGVVITGIVTAIYLLGYVDELLYWSGRRMNFNDFMQDDLNPKKLPSTWINDQLLVFQDDDGSLMLFNTENDTITTLVTNHTLRQLNVKYYQCSKDLKYVLLQHNVRQIFRQSFTAHYTVYDIRTDYNIPIRLENSSQIQYERLQFVTWLGSTSALLLITSTNDIFLRPQPSHDRHIRLTFTGQPDVIYNGIADWLYQEEILSKPETIWVSSDSRLVLYAMFNDTETTIMTYPWLNINSVFKPDNSNSFNDTFPGTRFLHYPRAGSINPKVQFFVLNMTDYQNVQSTIVTAPIELSNESYFTSAGWIGNRNDKISIVWLNRAQNLSLISICEAPAWKCEKIHVERAIENSWLKIVPHPIFAPDSLSFLTLTAVQESNSEYFTHIKHVSLRDKHVAVLSHGRHEVVRILAWDYASHIVYYEAMISDRMRERHLFSVNDPNHDTNKHSENKCVTCDLIRRHHTKSKLAHFFANCSYYQAIMSPKNDRFLNSAINFMVLECKGPTMPYAGLFAIRGSKLIRLLYNTRNGHIQNRLMQLALPIYRSISVPLSFGNRAEVQLLLPPSWREELRDATYPVLIEINGKPGEKIVTDQFTIDWGVFMCSHNDIVYMKIDVRRSWGPNYDHIYKQIDNIEIKDQIKVVNFLLNNYKFLDRNRIAIWGWGYGAFVTLMLLGSHQTLFKCGIAISPITDWLYYNSAFTERLLGLPGDNYKAYVEADVTQKSKNIPSESLLLVHGLADLSVPYIHSLNLIRALIKAGIIFRFQNYPDEGHDLYNVRNHLYKSMENFLGQCLNLDIEE